MKTPSVLYKYIKADYALTVLQNLKLKVTPPSEFDDPFEFLMRVEGNMQRSRVKKMLKGKENERQLYELARAQRMPVGSFKDFKRGFRTNESSM